MRILAVLILMVGLLSSTMIAAAQTNWEIAIFDETAQQIVIINASGIRQTISMPEHNGQPLKVTAISPDYRYAAGFLPGSSEYAFLPAIADLTAQTCCLMFDVPEDEPFFTQFSNFAPDNTIILSTNNYDWNTNTGGGLVFLVDAVSGATVKQKQLDVFANPGDWDGTDFYYLDAPLGGTEWLPVGNYNVWETDTDAITESDTRFALFRGEVLAATGEAVDGVYNDQFPLPYTEYMFPPSNTIAYYPASTSAAKFDDIELSGGTTVFFSPRILEGRAVWVRNGDAVLVYTDFFDGGVIVKTQMAVVFRTGAAQEIEAINQQFIAGTPDGWLMLNTQTNDLLHYIVTETGFQTQTVGNFSGIVVAISQPKLTPTMTGTFPEFVLPQATIPPNPAQCAGALPSRLQVGELGWVLPGDPNNFRSSPSISGEQIGQLAGSLIFTVLEGPECADNFAWFRVRDNYGIEGWTAEGNSNGYWLAPLN